MERQPGALTLSEDDRRVLAVPADPNAATEEVLAAQRHASAAVREILLKLPPPPRSGGMLGSLVYDLHTGLAVAGEGRSR